MHANGPFEGAEQAGRMTGMGAKSAPPIGAERPVQDGPIGGRGPRWVGTRSNSRPFQLRLVGVEIVVLLPTV